MRSRKGENEKGREGKVARGQEAAGSVPGVGKATTATLDAVAYFRPVSSRGGGVKKRKKMKALWHFLGGTRYIYFAAGGGGVKQDAERGI